MSWASYRLSEGSKYFTVAGEGDEWEAVVYQGAMKGDCYRGLRALGMPVFASDVINPWKIMALRIGPEGDNTRPNRRYLLFTSPSAPGFMLRFSEDVPAPLLDALRAAFRGPSSAAPQGDDDEGTGREEQRTPEDAVGDRSGIGADGGDRQTPRGRRPGSKGLPEGKVGKRKPPKRRAHKRRT